MTPETILALQWTALVAFLLMAVVAVVVGWRRPSLRAVAWALFLVALNHAAWYVSFLIFPDWLDGPQTMFWSVIVRMHVAFTSILWLAIGARRSPR